MVHIQHLFYPFYAKLQTFYLTQTLRFHTKVPNVWLHTTINIWHNIDMTCDLTWLFHCMILVQCMDFLYYFLTSHMIILHPVWQYVCSKHMTHSICLHRSLPIKLTWGFTYCEIWLYFGFTHEKIYLPFHIPHSKVYFECFMSSLLKSCCFPHRV